MSALEPSPVIFSRSLSPFLTAIFLFASPMISQAASTGLGVPLEMQESLVLSTQDNNEQIRIQFQRKHLGLEILTAGSTAGNPSSLFGHSLFRLIDDDENPLNDTVVGFEMLPLGKNDDTLKGLFGRYQVVPRVMTFSVYLLRYVLNESRSLHRVILPSKPENIEALKAVVLRLLSVPDLAGGYSFFTNNCLTVLKKVLVEAGYPLQDRTVDVPVQFSQTLISNMVVYAPPLKIPSAEDVLQERICAYQKEFQKKSSCAFSFISWKIKNGGEKKRVYYREFLQDENFWNFLAKSPAHQISLLINFWPYTLDAKKPGDLVSLENQSRLSKLRSLLGENFISLKRFLQPLDFVAYQRCDRTDETCRRDRQQAALKFWSRSALEKVQRSSLVNESGLRARIPHLASVKTKSVLSWLDSEIVQDMLHFL